MTQLDIDPDTHVVVYDCRSDVRATSLHRLSSAACPIHSQNSPTPTPAPTAFTAPRGCGGSCAFLATTTCRCWMAACKSGRPRATLSTRSRRPSATLLMTMSRRVPTARSPPAAARTSPKAFAVSSSAPCLRCRPPSRYRRAPVAQQGPTLPLRKARVHVIIASDQDAPLWLPPPSPAVEWQRGHSRRALAGAVSCVAHGLPLVTNRSSHPRTPRCHRAQVSRH